MSETKKVRVLSLNGGGVRGLFTISVLAEIEQIVEDRPEHTDVKIGDYFDLITGTSIGGILALGLAYGKSARELQKVFKSEAPKIFPHRPTWINFVRRLRKPLYDSAPLQKTVASMVGEDSRFSDLNRRVMIPAVNLSTGRPQFFKTPHNPDFNRDGKLKLLDAAMATSAAPTYFAPHYCSERNSYFADGGIIANNPAFIGLHEVLRDMTSDYPGATPADVNLLNIGTLGDAYTISPKILKSKRQKGYAGLWGAGERLVLTTMAANQQLHQAMLEREMNSHEAMDNFVSIDEPVPNESAGEITLDNASESTLANLISRGKQLASEEFSKTPQLKNFFIETADPFVTSQRRNSEVSE